MLASGVMLALALQTIVNAAGLEAAYADLKTNP